MSSENKQILLRPKCVDRLINCANDWLDYLITENITGDEYHNDILGLLELLCLLGEGEQATKFFTAYRSKITDVTSKTKELEHLWELMAKAGLVREEGWMCLN